MRELVVVVAIVDENLIHDNLGSCPNLATNVQRKPCLPERGMVA